MKMTAIQESQLQEMLKTAREVYDWEYAYIFENGRDPLDEIGFSIGVREALYAAAAEREIDVLERILGLERSPKFTDKANIERLWG